MYLPVVGLICWAYDFPFLNRGKQAKKRFRKINRVKIHLDTISFDELKANLGLPETDFNSDRAIEWINQRWGQKDRKIEHISSDFG